MAQVEATAKPSHAELKLPGVGRPPAAPALLSAPPDVVGLLKSLVRCWPQALVAALFCAALAAAAAKVLIKSWKFTAKSTLQVASSPTRFTQTLESQTAFDTYRQSQVGLIRSRTVIQDAFKKLHADNQPLTMLAGMTPDQQREWVESNIQIESSSNSELLRVSLNGNNDAELHALFKNIMQSYLEVFVQKEQREREQRRDQIKAHHDQLEAELYETRLKIEQELTKLGSTDQRALALQIALANERLTAANADLSRIESRLRTAEIDLASEKAKEKMLDKMPVPEYEITAALGKEKDPLIEKYRNDLLDLEDSVKQAPRYYREPQLAKYVKEKEKKMQDLKKLMGRENERIKPAIETVYRERMKYEYRLNYARLEEQVSKLREEYQVLTNKVEILSKQEKGVSRSTAHLESLQRSISASQNVQEKAKKDLEDLRLELQSPPRVKIIEEPVVTRSKDEKKPTKMAFLAGMGTFCLVMFGFAWWDFTARKIVSAEDINQGLGIKVLGTLPLANSAAQLGLVPPTAPKDAYKHHLFTEAIDSLRSVLLFSARSQQMKCFMLTSAVSGEGKTTQATHLAASFARAGDRTLLLDSDLRNPSAHRALGLSLNVGLSEVLRGEVSLEEACQLTAFENLTLLSGGRCDGRALQALIGDKPREVLQALKQRFDFIIIDSSPILPVADSLTLAPHCDGVVLSLLKETSQARKVHAAAQRLQMFGIKLLGASLSGTTDNAYMASQGRVYVRAPGRESAGS